MKARSGKGQCKYMYIGHSIKFYTDLMSIIKINFTNYDN